MRHPEIPPPYWRLLPELLETRGVLGSVSDPAPAGRYRHWDRLRRLSPPPGLTHELWWASIKLARQGITRSLPLTDVRGALFRYAMPDIAQELVHRIDRQAQGQSDFHAGEDAARLGQDKSYLVNSLIEEAITSSQLEGASTTRQVAKEMIRSGRPPQDNSERMILNNYQAMNRVRTLAETKLTPREILELHTILTVGTVDAGGAGRFRRANEDIRVVDPDGEAVHIPPPAEELESRVQKMCDFANADTPFIHPVVRSILLHFWLAYDHPFVDGNGRTARALFYWSMLRHGYWLSEYLSISRILRKASGKYARSFLYTETDDNDTTYFILAQLAVIQQAIRELNAYLAKKLEERRATEALLKKSASVNHRQLALLTHALKNPGWQYTVESHQNSHRTAYETARSDLLELEQRKLIIKRRQGKRFVFEAPRDLVKRLKGR